MNSSIPTLPLEIIVEILKELDWQSLLTIREICKLLDDISGTRPIWISQYRQYIAQHMSVARLEEPLDFYSPQELERWVLVRRSADISWKGNDTTTSSRIRKINHNASGACLIPGGRWLLLGGWDGSLTAYDLDASTPSGRLLIPRDGQQPVNDIVFDIATSKQFPNLTSTVALSPVVFTSSVFPSKSDIWQVTLAGHGVDALLTVTHLCSIQTDHDQTCINGTAIRENIFARIHQQPRLSYIEVYDWKQSTSLPHWKDDIFTGVKIDAIRLLPGDRLPAFSRAKMMIYGFITARVDTTPQPLFRISQNLFGSHPSV